MPEPGGPFPLGGVELPTWIIRFDKGGICTSSETQQALSAEIDKHPKPTHIIFMSHGWNSDFSDAISQYQAFLKAFEGVVRDHPPTGDYRPLFVGVTWPSVWFPLDRGPRLAGPDSEAPARQKVLQAVAADIDGPAAQKRFAELLNKDRLSMDEVREAAALAMPSLAKVEDTEIPTAEEPLAVDHVVRAAAHVQAAIDPPQPATRPGTFTPARLQPPTLPALSGSIRAI